MSVALKSIVLKELLHETLRAVDLGTRSNDENDELEDALRKYLGRSIVKRPQEATTERYRKLSMYITDVGLSERTFRYLHVRGFRFVGEVYMLRFGGSGNHERPKVLEELQERLGLEHHLRPLEEGWRPPYWDDPGFVTALNCSLDAYSGGPIWGLHDPPRWWRGTCMGDFLIDQRKNTVHGPRSIPCDGRTEYGPGRMERLQKRLAGGNLHGAMIIPADWTPPAAKE